MKESGLVNRGMSKILAEQGHGDLIMVVDAGFAIPKEVEVVDLSLRENFPSVLDVLQVLQPHFSVEEIVMAHETKTNNPTFFKSVSKAISPSAIVSEVSHVILKEKAKEVKAIIRTGDFTAYANVLLVSGAGDRWYFESSNGN